MIQRYIGVRIADLRESFTDQAFAEHRKCTSWPAEG